MQLNQFKTLINFGYPTKDDKKKYQILVIIFFILSCFLSFHARNLENSYWDSSKDIFYSNDTKLIRGTDPGYYLSSAKFHKENQNKSLNQLRIYPLNNDPSLSNEKISYPLLSKVISFLSVSNQIGDLISAGNLLVLISSILTSMAIILVFGSMGYWFEGSIAALGGSLSAAFYQRSGIGNIDTDILNLGFYYLIFALILFAFQKKDFKKSLIIIFFAGLIGNIFYEWYPKYELFILATCSIIWLSLISKSYKNIIIFPLLFLTISGTLLTVFNDFTSSLYLKEVIDFKGLVFENNIQGLIETTKLPFSDYLRLIAGNTTLGAIGILGIILWGIKHPKYFVALVPLFLFILFSKFLGVRAIFYSAPFIWFGIAFCSFFIVNLFLTVLSKANSLVIINPIYLFSILTSFLLALIWILRPLPNFSKLHVDRNVVEGLIHINELNNQNDATIASIMDYGYHSMFYNENPTFVDPGSPGSHRHYLIDRALMAINPNESINIFQYLQNGLDKKIQLGEIKTADDLFEDIMSTDNRPSQKPIYLFLTNQMSKGWLKKMIDSAYWDIERGEQVLINDKRPSDIITSLELNCESLDQQSLTTNCSDEYSNQALFNLKKGSINNNPILKQAIMVRDGEIIANEKYDSSQGNLVFQIFHDTNQQKYYFYLSHEQFFKSIFNQTFHLNLLPRKFEKIYDNYPYVRIFKIVQ